MFEVIVPSQPMQSGLFPGSKKEANSPAGMSGEVHFSKVAVFARLTGQLVRCLSGRLWVTIENDPKDHVLKPGEQLVVPTDGKVIVGGKGRYSV